ncbi:MAG: tetratricopeptide repeat protein [Proteobacteria bacterium]|nr:tetratricopeptide repeat protein [Pseudomonadota bacterium]
MDGDDIYGDGVNVAARLEGLCDTREVYVSAVVHDQVEGKIEATFEDLGEHTVKNIDKPIGVYRVSDQAGTPVKATTVEGADELPLPDKPSIAVLPFDNMSGDPEQEYFSDGISEDIITALSRIRQFSVIARNTTFTYKGQAVDVQVIANDLGVRYILEGSVRKAGDRVRITAQLIDGDTGKHLWAERYDRELKDIFAIQDEITQTVVGAIQPELSRAEQNRARRKTPESLDAWDYYQRGLWHVWRYEKDDSAEAKRLLQRAIEIDPNLAPAFAALAWAHLQDFVLGFHDDSAAALEGISRCAEQALKLDEREAIAYNMRGGAHLFRRNHAAARTDLEMALDIDPSLAFARMTLGMVHNWCNQPDDAISHFDEAERLSPKDPSLWLSLMGRCLAYLIRGEFEEADKAGKRAIAIPNATLIVHFIHTAALGHLGHLDEARTSIETMLRINPKFSMKYVDRVLPTNEQNIRDVILDGLRKAGAPE